MGEEQQEGLFSGHMNEREEEEGYFRVEKIVDAQWDEWSWLAEPGQFRLPKEHLDEVMQFVPQCDPALNGWDSSNHCSSS